jgi:hypothetical protein
MRAIGCRLLAVGKMEGETMTAISGVSTAMNAQLEAVLPLRRNTSQAPMVLDVRPAGQPSRNPSLKGSGTEEELREKFTQFVGEAFYGQMLKSMRSTVGKPAYFHGGRAEEAFQGQLDQTMSQELTKATASKFAEPMFERQFPQFGQSPRTGGLEQLAALSQR